ncbi:MAG: uracil-DNA glycosylase [Casimicrobiaceae bacterium]
MPEHSEWLREMGIAPRWRLRRQRAPAHPPSVAQTQSTSVASADPTSVAQERALPAARLARIKSLPFDALAADIDACTACPLCRTRHRTVPGVGDSRASWLFVGEAPGADEDAQGEPFVGQAGRLLDNMLAALGLARDRDVYIANVLKCRPPNNRTPALLEVDACLPYLDRQIELIAPKLIVALGKSAAAALLGIDQPVAAMRGRVHRYRGTVLIVTYHPAYLLRSPVEKAKAWDDLLFARRTLRELSGLHAAAG